MAYKIFKKSGYFYIIDTITGREREGLSKDVKVSRGTDIQDDFYFKYVNNWSPNIAINITEIQKANGDLYDLDEFISFYESANSVDVNIQDSTAPLLIVPFSALITETTLTTQTSKDDYIVNVADATSFVAGQLLTIYDVDSNRVYFAVIIAINTLAITLDTPLDFEFPIGSFVSVGNTNMNVDGSVTPVIYGVRNPTAEDIPLSVDVTRIILHMQTSTTVDLSKFGDITGGLTNGIVIRKVNNSYKNIFNAKTNGTLKNIMFDLDIETASGNQQDGLTARFTFGGQEKLGAVIRLSSNEDLQVIIQDDLSSLEEFTVIAEGSEVTE